MQPFTRLYYDPRYYAANVFDPDGYSLEAVYKIGARHCVSTVASDDAAVFVTWWAVLE